MNIFTNHIYYIQLTYNITLHPFDHLIWASRTYLPKNIYSADLTIIFSHTNGLALLYDHLTAVIR